ncbi:MAG TPA: hypothetical protein DDW30_08495 [Clostridiales bacterium]|nr:hypothetical protein [Clostridiales bacterium]
MKPKQMERLTRHFDRYFGQTNNHVLHPIVDNGFHVDVLLYEPTETYPFWKLATMGASDYKMPKAQPTFGLYNEYVMFVDRGEDLGDKRVAAWYYGQLVRIASYAKFCDTHVTYGHSLEWEPEDPEDEMMAAFLELPQIIPDGGILHCRLGLLRTVTCLQVVLLNKAELGRLMEIGPQAFSEYLYPEEKGKKHFLSERHRTEKF